MRWLVENGPALTAIVAGLAFLVALVGLCVARAQLILNRRNQRETIAKGLYRDYLKLACDRPKFAYPQLLGLRFDVRPANGKSAEEFESYEWFVAYMLHACEEVLATHESSLWQDTVKEQVVIHREYICGVFKVDKFDKHYTQAMREVIKNARLEANCP